MTQQFKFGDIVKDDHLGYCVVINTTEHFVYIMNEKGNYNTVANPEHLEYIPHPDTVRLERIGRLAVDAMGMKFDLDEYRRQIDATIQKEKNA